MYIQAQTKGREGGGEGYMHANAHRESKHVKEFIQHVIRI